MGKKVKLIHHGLDYKKRVKPNKTYKELKLKQKDTIADWMYQETLLFYLRNQRMPDKEACDLLCQAIYKKIENQAIWVPYREVLAQYRKRQRVYEERIVKASAAGVTEQDVVKKKEPKVKELKSKKPPSRRKKEKNEEVGFNDWQDDRFYFIAGYTSGGAPYGLTWEEMGLEPWQNPDDDELLNH